ncbi:2OG-Fe(II) oxygenase [Solimicrobium silvestre]|uniref:Fe2OG dioxygenase domain-containing protein n=1 Tax=Solimicrobium silvestre TaxID=2099400 RepID=A0A2S9H399_9BURK|nr:2OG-Fe(II) oxygenase [Solimicrobium silvestre]PRC94413.1 hypothetical protein S2091_1034 [Solimicrobium silvestre]
MSTNSHKSMPALHLQDWASIEKSLDAGGNAVLPDLLTSAQCEELVVMYSQEERYRSRVVMARHGFGLGEYKYFAYPLPDMLAKLRDELYPHLAIVANRWNQLMGNGMRYPANLHTFIERCHAAGQTRPTPLILKYGEGDYNCLHQDLYGEHVFPLQIAILLARPGEDFTGGEFVMTERGSSQLRADVVPLKQGDGVIFTVYQRPTQGRRSMRKVAMRHGVSKIRSGSRHAVGLIFHDAH